MSTGSGKRIWAGVLALTILLLTLAWIGGGREPLREIVTPVPMPEGAR